MLTVETVQKLLEEERFDCQIIEGGGGKLLSIFVGEDYRQRGYWATLRITPQLLRGAMGKGAEQGEPARYYSSTYSLEFPFAVKARAIADAARLIAFLNNSIELPGFQLDEISGRLSYRYVTLIAGETFGVKSALAVLGTLFMLKELYAETLEKVSSGSVSMNELFEEIAAILKVGANG